MTSTGSRILLVGDTDSRIAWVQRLGMLLAKDLYSSDEGTILIDARLTSILRRVFHAREVDISAFDVIILGLGGGANQKFCAAFNDFFKNDRFARRPMVIAGFNGICDPSDPNILFSRMGADIVLANCKSDVMSFRKLLCAIQYPETDKVLLLGYAVHDDGRIMSGYRKGAKRKMLLFVGQPDVPNSLRERCYVVSQLVNLAKKNPTWLVKIKPRSRIGAIGVTHAELYFYQEILDVFFKNRPENIEVDYRSVNELLDEADICATVGSTVALEAIQRGVRTVVVSDFGVRRNYGNHHFLASGCMGALADLELDSRHASSVDPIWKDARLSFAHENIKILSARLREMLSMQTVSGLMYPLAIPVYQASKFPYLKEAYAWPKISLFGKFVFRARACGIRLWKRLLLSSS